MITLKGGKIIEQWAILIEQCKGEEEGFFRMVEGELAAYDPPGVTWKRESVAPGFWKGLRGKRRDFVLVNNERFDDYLMCIGARDYGTTLDVSWYLLVSRKGMIRWLLSLIPGVGLLLRLSGQLKDLDVFDQQDLTAYVTVGHHAVLKAVEDLMRKRNLDLARLERKSRGMFGVS